MAACDVAVRTLLVFPSGNERLGLHQRQRSGLVTSTLPIWIALGAWYWLGEKTTRNLWIGLIMALAGTATMTLLGESSERPRIRYWATA